MAKRFTDTGKWKKAWFRSLPPKAKIAWFYILDECDHAGIWDIDIDLMCYQIGYKITLEELLEFLGDRVELFDNKLLIKPFIEYQYGNLNEKSKIHKSVMKLIDKLTLTKGLGNPYVSVKDKDKDKDKDKVKEKEEEGSVRGETISYELLEREIYGPYPRKEGKTKGLTKLKNQIKTKSDYEKIFVALGNYKHHVASQNINPDFIKHFSTWVSEWKDWIDADHGKIAVMKLTREQRREAFVADMQKKYEAKYGPQE